jgi:hypothetical protein
MMEYDSLFKSPSKPRRRRNKEPKGFDWSLHGVAFVLFSFALVMSIVTFFSPQAMDTEHVSSDSIPVPTPIEIVADLLLTSPEIKRIQQDVVDKLQDLSAPQTIHLVPQPATALEMKWADPKSHGRMLPRTENTMRSSRTYYLLSSVGLCAVVVGVTVGRRVLKQQQFLEEIWDRRLEHDLAYDIAYTTSSSDIGYGSLASSWGGDLEKFDV